MTFQLTKWYFDCIGSDGSAFIGYWARLRYRKVQLRYAAALIARANEAVRHVSSILRPAAPRNTHGCCNWACPQIGVAGEWRAAVPPLKPLTLRNERGMLRWLCFQPLSHAEVTIRHDDGSLPISGLGYAERLDLTIPPWRLPFDTLYWGHYVSREHALVWLEWQNTRAEHRSRRRYANLDGSTDTDGVITDNGIRAAHAQTSFCDSRPLRHGALIDTVFGAIPVLNRVLPEGFKRAYEAKSVSRSELRLPDGSCDHGWSIHEMVRW